MIERLLKIARWWRDFFSKFDDEKDLTEDEKNERWWANQM